MADEEINRLVSEFHCRAEEFDRQRRADFQDLRADALTGFIREHILLGNKSQLERVLRAMLTEAEHYRLGTDPEFSAAWRVFVDVWWLRKQLRRAGLMAGAVLILLALLALLFWAVPQVLGPENR